MTVLELYVILRLPAAFILSLIIFSGKEKKGIVEFFKKRISKAETKISGIGAKPSKAKNFRLLFVCFFWGFFLPLLVITMIIMTAHHFYLTFITYFAIAIDMILGLCCIQIKKLFNTGKNGQSSKEISNKIENICISFPTQVIGPIICFMVGGSPLCLFYVCICATKDKNFTVRKIVSYVPIKIASYISILVTFILPEFYSPIRACKIYYRDRFKRFENNGSMPSLTAGALGIILGGDLFGDSDESYYRPLIGDRNKECDGKDLKKTKLLLFIVAVIFVLGLSTLKAYFTLWS